MTKNSKFNIAISLGVALVVFFTIMDAVAFFGLYKIDAFYQNDMMPAFGMIFWLFAYGMVVLLAIIYFLFRRDKSEVIAIIITPVLLLWAGTEDILFGIFTWQYIPEFPWLSDNISGILPNFWGYPAVPLWSLFMNLGIAIGLLYIIIPLLRKI